MNHSTPIEDNFTNWRENPHPSRSAPLCKDCKHLVSGREVGSRFDRCNHPAAPVELVTGKPKATIDRMRDEYTPDLNCGAFGTWFEASPSVGCKTCAGRGHLVVPAAATEPPAPGIQKVSCPTCLPQSLSEGLLSAKFTNWLENKKFRPGGRPVTAAPPDADPATASQA